MQEVVNSKEQENKNKELTVESAKARIDELFSNNESLRFGSTICEDATELEELKKYLLGSGISQEELEDFIRSSKLEAERKECELIKMRASWYNSPQAAFAHNLTVVQRGLRNAWLRITERGKTENIN